MPHRQLFWSILLLLWVAGCTTTFEPVPTPAAATATSNVEPTHTVTTLPANTATAQVPTATRTPATTAPATAAPPAGPTNEISLLSGTIVPTPTVLPRITPSPTTQPPISWALQGEVLPPAGAPITPANIASLTLLARWGRGVINDVAYSPDGNLLAVATTSGVYLHDAQNLTTPPQWLRTSLAVDQVVFSPDGTEIAAILHRDSIQIWSLGTESVITTIPEKSDEIAFSADGQFLFSHWSYELSVWSLNENQQIAFFEDVHAFAASPVESLYVAAQQDGPITSAKLFELPNSDLRQTLSLTWDNRLYNDFVDSLAFSPDGTLLLIGRRAPLHSISGEVEAVRVADSTLLYTIDPVWPQFPTKPFCDSEIASIEPYPFPIVADINFSPDGQIAAIRYDDATVGRIVTHFHRVADGALIQTLDEDNVGLTFNPTGAVLSFTDTGKLHRWSGLPLTLHETLYGYDPAYRDLQMFPSGNRLAAVADRVVQLIRAQDGTVEREYPDANQITIAANGSRFALAYRDGHIEMRDQASGGLLYQLPAAGAAIDQISLSPDGNYLVVARADCEHLVYRTQSGVLTGRLEAISYDFAAEFGESRLRINSLAFAPDGQQLAGTMMGIGHLAIWTIPGGELTVVAEPELYGGIHLLSPMPGTSMFAGVGSLRYYRDLSLWDFSSSSQTFSFDVPDSLDGFMDLIVTNQSQLIAASTFEGSIEFWHESSSNPLLVFAAPDFALRRFGVPYVCAMAFSLDDHYLYGATGEGSIFVWGVPD